ncbi:MAG: Ku protein [Anaerolineales bacterium]|nr:Ku protein [Anaerolineales bacterium]
MPKAKNSEGKSKEEKGQKKAAGGARAIWSGAIAFGLINIPVKLFSATQEYQLSFNQLRRGDLSRIKYLRVAANDGQEVPYEDIIKGYEIEEDVYVVIDEEDIKQASPKKTQSIEILTFTNEDEIDSIYFEKPYYTAPDKTSARAYVLLREALKASKKVAVCKFILRTKENLAILKAEGDALILNQIRFQSEIRERDHLDLPGGEAMKDKELELALNLVEQLTEPFDPAQYRDTFTDEIKQIIEQKAQGIDVTAMAAAKPEATDEDDLLKILQASLEKSKTSVDA